MIKMAIRSLKKNPDRAFFFWLVFVLSSMFLVIFYRLALSSVGGVTLINNKSNLPTWLIVIDTVVCMTVIFLANDFFVRNKAKELAAILICGGTYWQVVAFLLSQTCILMALSVPIGIFAANTVFPLVGLIMSQTSGNQVDIELSTEAIIAAVCTIGAEVLWCSVLNLGYSYRNTIYYLLHEKSRIKLQGLFGRSPGRLRYLYLMLCIIPAAMLYACGDNTAFMVCLGALGLLGMYQSIKWVLTPYLESAVADKWVFDPEKVIYMGLFRADLKIVQIYAMLFIGIAILYSSIIAGASGNAANMVLALLSLCLVLPMLALSMMFRFSTECIERKKHFSLLVKLGYQKEQLRRIMKKELICLYGFVLLASLVYVLNMVIVLRMQELITQMVGILILASMFPPLLICGGVSYVYYAKTI